MNDRQAGEGTQNDGDARERRTARNVGLGCFTAFIGLWSGAMVAVLIGAVVDDLRKAPRCEGLPTCTWYYYAFIGALIGMVTLPLLVLTRLRWRAGKPTTTRG